MRTIFRCNSIFCSRVSFALTGASAKWPWTGSSAFFSAVAVGFLLTEKELIGGKGKCSSVVCEIKRGVRRHVLCEARRTLAQEQETDRTVAYRGVSPCPCLARSREGAAC